MLPNPDGTDWWLNAIQDIQQKLHTIEDYEMAVPIVVSMILRDRVELMFRVSSQYHKYLQ